jgi:hypothetical protein
MNNSIENLLFLTTQFEKLAKKQKVKLDPKAKTRSRGTCVFPAEHPKVKDHKDHFLTNTEAQARAALSYAGHYTSAPPWFSGSLEELKNAIRRKVKSKYPGIEVSEPKKKKSNHFDTFLTKLAQAKQINYTNQPGSQVSWNPSLDNANEWKPTEAPVYTLPTMNITLPARKPAMDPNVQKAQILLSQVPKYKALLGTSGPNHNGVDGIMGPKTHAALQLWKADRGLSPNTVDAVAINMMLHPDRPAEKAPDNKLWEQEHTDPWTKKPNQML